MNRHDTLGRTLELVHEHVRLAREAPAPLRPGEMTTLPSDIAGFCVGPGVPSIRAKG